MDCREFRQLLEAEGVPESDEARAHAEDCSVCRELAGDEGRLAEALGTVSDEGGGPEMDVAALEREIDREERDVLASVYERGTGVRMLFPLVVGVAVALWIFLAIPRPDLGAYPTGLFWGLAAGFVALTGGLVAAGLRPLHRPDWSAARRWGLLGGALAYGLAVGAIPPPHRAVAISMGGVGPELLPAATQCFIAGTIFAVPVLAIAWVASRTRGSFLFRGMFLAAAAGLIGNLGLHFHCPIVQPPHLLLGHATVPVAYTLLCGIGIYVLDR